MNWFADPYTLAAIAMMALATFACRAGGYVVFRSTRPTPFIRDILAYIPGTLFMAYLAPAVLNGGPAHWVATAVTVAVMATMRNISLALLAGIATAWGLSLL